MGGARAASCATARPRLLVLTHPGDEDIYQALKAGARGYLTKESSGDELLSAIRALHAGRRFLPPAILESIASRQRRPELTRRERHVLERVADGASNREVGSARHHRADRGTLHEPHPQQAGRA